MIRKSQICIIYFFALVFIGAVAAHNETFGTAIRLVAWFVIPMSLTFFLEILILKSLTYKKVLICALLNTIVMFVALLLIGIRFLENHNLIHY